MIRLGILHTLWRICRTAFYSCTCRASVYDLSIHLSLSPSSLLPSLSLACLLSSSLASVTIIQLFICPFICTPSFIHYIIRPSFHPLPLLHFLVSVPLSCIFVLTESTSWHPGMTVVSLKEHQRGWKVTNMRYSCIHYCGPKFMVWLFYFLAFCFVSVCVNC